MVDQGPRTSAPESDGKRRCANCSGALAADNTSRLCGRCVRERQGQLCTPPVLPDEFWSTDDLRAAFESQHMGHVFRAYRNHPHHLQLFGRVFSQELLGRWLDLTQAQVSRFENGRPEQNLETLRIYSRTLRIPQKMLWFDLPGRTRITARYSPGVPGLLGDPARHVVFGPSSRRVLRAAEPKDFTPKAAVANRDPHVLVSRLADARTHFELMYRNSEPFLAKQTLSFIAGMTAHAGVRRALASLVALAGVCAYDSEDWISANSHFAQALAIAEMFSDYSFHAYVLALMVNQALALEDYQTAEHLAGTALRSSAKVLATPLTIDLQVMRAKALASMGDASAALTMVRNLETSMSKLPAGNEIAEASYAQEGHLQAQLAEALASLGDLSAARHYGEQSLRSHGHARGKVNRLASMVALEVAGGELERASMLACEMVDNAQGMESRRLAGRFVKLRPSLASKSTTVSRDAIDRIDRTITLMS
jgi:hypothetical protein